MNNCNDRYLNLKSELMSSVGQLPNILLEGRGRDRDRTRTRSRKRQRSGNGWSYSQRDSKRLKTHN